jgi:two-component system, NarL family, response regulator DevR
MSVIRVFICEDDLIFRASIAEFLELETDIAVAGLASNVDELMEGLKQVAFDVLLLDINLSSHDHDGIQAAFEIKTSYPHVKTIILSSLDHKDVISDAIILGGAINYIVKEHYRDLPDAIRNAAMDRSGIHHSSAGKMIQSFRIAGENDLRQRIKPRQIEILRMLQEGYTRKEIAKAFFYSEQSINNEICKATAVLKGRFPYLAWLRLKKHNTKEIVDLAQKLNLL